MPGFFNACPFLFEKMRKNRFSHRSFLSGAAVCPPAWFFIISRIATTFFRELQQSFFEFLIRGENSSAFLPFPLPCSKRSIRSNIF